MRTPGPYRMHITENGCAVTGTQHVSVAWFGCSLIVDKDGSRYRIDVDEATDNARAFVGIEDMEQEIAALREAVRRAALMLVNGNDSDLHDWLDAPAVRRALEEER